jgi:integrative and conjugative element protein (TIGR02256 family)
MLRLKRRKYSPTLTLSTTTQTPKLLVSPEVCSFITATATASPSAETGGILMGFHDGDDISVVRASDAGLNARRSACGFLRDTKHCQAVLDAEHARSGADYVGEWHTHVIDLPRPSEGDLATLAGIILDQDYGFPSFAMMLGVKVGGTFEIVAYVVTAEASEYEAEEERQAKAIFNVRVVQAEIVQSMPKSEVTK